MTAIAKVEPKQFGIEEKKAQELASGLTTILDERSELVKTYKEIIKLEVTEENIPEFKNLRLRIRDNRTKGIEVWHQKNKAYFLAGGRFIDAIKNKESDVNLRMEEKLAEGEKYFEKLEQERLDKLNADRIAQVAPFVEDTTGMNLSLMDEDVWEAYLTAKKNKWEAAQAEAKKLEEERLEKERLDKLESDRRYKTAQYWEFMKDEPNYRGMNDKQFAELLEDLQKAKAAKDKKNAEIEAENEKLKKDAEKKAAIRSSRSIALRPYLAFVPDIQKDFELSDKEFQKALAGYKKEFKDAEEFKAKQAAEKKKQDAVKAKNDAKIQEELRLAREAKEKLEKEESDRKAAEAKKIADDKAKAAKLAKAPVKEKLNLWVDSFSIPDTDVKNLKVDEINRKFQAFKKWAKIQVDEI